MEVVQIVVTIIGTCRAVWVPGQGLATPQLWKAYFVTTLYAIYTSECAQARVCYIGVFMSGPCDMSMHDSK